MARHRKLSTKTEVDDEATPTQVASISRSHSPEAQVLQESSLKARDETCPACALDENGCLNSFEKERWVRCDACKAWYHWRCVGQGDDLNTIDKWFCQRCIDEKPSRAITRKAPIRKSSRKRTQRDYANLDSGMGFDPARWLKVLEDKETKGDPFKRIHGGDLSLLWVEQDENAMQEPIIIEKPDGLGMKMPANDLSVGDVAKVVGGDTPVEVIDVATQSTSPGWTLEKWAEYMDLEPGKRDKILNVISLEISGTKLADMILPPRIVRELDWVENYWPSTRKGKGYVYPKVQLYCLMGVATAWTDWHIDFAGSSVYYHVLHGSKVFYFIRPTTLNLAAYERWSGTELQYQSWLGDMVDGVYRVELKEGNTMIIPSGWIHAVYTPVDTMVFGGNFLHSFSVPTQLRVRNIEIVTQVPRKFRFPQFSRLCWYVGDKYLRDLRAHPEAEFSPRLLASLLALADFLVSEARLLERGAEGVKKEVKEQVPSDRVKDAPAMARELRWRLRLIDGPASEDESCGRLEKANGYATNGTKRRRGESEEAEEHTLRFRNFKPRTWDRVEEKTADTETEIRQVVQPTSTDDWSDPWVELNAMDTMEGGVQATQVQRQRKMVVKIRKTARGIERQRIERVVEYWTWHNGE